MFKITKRNVFYTSCKHFRSNTERSSGEINDFLPILNSRTRILYDIVCRKFYYHYSKLHTFEKYTYM